MRFIIKCRPATGTSRPFIIFMEFDGMFMGLSGKRYKSFIDAQRVIKLQFPEAKIFNEKSD